MLVLSGNLTYPSIAANDILGIGTERVKVLNVDKKRSRIRILRAVDGTVATCSYSNFILLPRST